MKSTKFIKPLIVAASMLISFSYGVFTVQYQIFPFEQLKTIKKTIIPDPPLGPVKVPVAGLSFSDYFIHKKSFFEKLGGNNFDVVFIGDSITDGAEWQELFPKKKIANRGISGDGTAGVIARLESITSTSASRAFIMIGLNDFTSWKSVNEVFDNYKNIVNQLVDHGMNVFIQSTIFVGKRLEAREPVNHKIAELNKRLQHFAKQSDSITYIDLNESLTNNLFLNPNLSMDDIHLNGGGYAIWRDIIKPYVE